MKVLIVCLIPSIGIFSLSRCFVQYAHLRVILTEFGVIRRLWRGSRDQCLLSDCCMVSLNLFVCGKCRLVAFCRWTCFVSVETILWFLGLFRVLNRWMKDSLMDSLENIRAYYVSALISNPVLPFYSVVQFFSWYEPINLIFLDGEPW